MSDERRKRHEQGANEHHEHAHPCRRRAAPDETPSHPAAGNAAAALDLAYLLREHPDLAQSTTEALVWCLRGQATATEALLTELTTLCDSLSAGLSPADRKAAMAEAAVTP